MTGKWKGFFNNELHVAALKLSAVWLPGLLLGVYIGSAVQQSYSPYVSAAYHSLPSFLGMLFVLQFPVLVTVVLAYCFHPNAVLVSAFLKSCAFSLFAVVTTQSCGSAGWLIRGLLLFSDCLSILVLLWLWLRILLKRSLQKMDLVCACVLIIAIGCMDYFLVSPFLISLF